MKGRLPAIAQPLRGVTCLRRQQCDQPVRGLRSRRDARQPIANQPMLRLQRVEHAGNDANGFRRGKQPQRVPGRRRVDDDEVVRLHVREPLDLHQSDQFVDAGKRQVQQRVDVAAIEPCTMLQDVSKGAPMILEPARERAGGIELDRVEAAPDLARRGRQFHVERVAERVRRIGGDDQHAGRALRKRKGGPVPPKRCKREGGGARRFTDASLSSVENQKGPGTWGLGASFPGQTRSSRHPPP